MSVTNSNLPTVQHLLDHLLNLIEKASIQENITLFKLFKQKIAVLNALHSGDPLTSSDQKFYNLTLQLLDESCKVRNYVQKKLQGGINLSISTTTAFEPYSLPISAISAGPSSNSLSMLEQKYQEAQYYETGERTCKNSIKAFQLYEELMQAGHTPSMLEVAFCLCFGQGTPIDLSRAAMFAKELLAKNLTFAQRGRALFIWGRTYQNGHFEGNVWKKNSLLAEECFKEAENLGDLFGAIYLSYLYLAKGDDWKAECLAKNYLPRLIQQAEKGDPIAQERLGVCYVIELGLKRDEKMAFFWYQKAADQENANARCSLGFCYEIGRGVEKDEEKAFFWYQKAAGQGHADAQFRLGCCYDNGQGVEKNEEKAVFWYQKAADQGHVLAQYNLGNCYENGQGVEKNEEKAVFWYQKAADQGDSDAQFSLGFCYENGQGVDKDEEKAFFWYQKAADQGDSDAQFSLGFCYDNGQGVEKNEEKAVLWYQKAADQGDSDAQFSLGFCYKKGRGVEKDEKKAVFWYQKAADQRNVMAQYNLGLCYKKGQGVEKDEKKAFLCHQKAADQGDVKAQFSLGLCYQKGRGVKKDEKKAFFWYQKAADQGFLKAQKVLKDMKG